MTRFSIMASVFRRDSSIRNSVSAQLLDQLPANCYFSKFISAVSSGYVCFDSDKMEYVSYYPEEYALGAAESLIDVESAGEDEEVVTESANQDVG